MKVCLNAALFCDMFFRHRAVFPSKRHAKKLHLWSVSPTQIPIHFIQKLYDIYKSVTAFSSTMNILTSTDIWPRISYSLNITITKYIF